MQTSAKEDNMSELLEEAGDIRDIQPDRLIKYRLSQDRLSAQVLFPGFWHTDFDSTTGGHLSLFAIARTFEGAGFATVKSGYAHLNRLIKEGDATIFHVDSTYLFSKELNSITMGTVWGYNKPLLFSFDVTKIGTSSYDSQVKMRDLKTGNILATLQYTGVYVNKSTRKSRKLPDWFLEMKNSVRTTKSISAPDRKQTDVPPDAYSYQIVPAFSDTDRNQHVNQAVYARWCTDVATSAALAGRYPDFTHSIGVYPIAHMSFQYLGEALVGEQVDIFTWQDLQEERTIRFIAKTKGKTIVVATFGYHATEAKGSAKL